MASIKDKTQPLRTGPNRGLFAVRWRRNRNGRQVTGYLPRATLLDDYTRYETECWMDGREPLAPEVRYREQVAELMTGRDGQVAAATEPPASSVPTMRQWIGTPEDPGDFFVFARKTHSTGKRRDYMTEIDRRERAHFVDKPLNRITTADITLEFQQRVACASCIRRAKSAGMKPGSKALPWTALVPRTDQPTWDKSLCLEHHTPIKRATIKGYRARLIAQFNATSTSDARQQGVQAVEPPVPSLRALTMDLLLKDDNDADTQGEELRCALTYDQVDSISDASLPEYRVLPMIATWTLSRAGQELALRRRDVVPVDSPFVFHDPELPACEIEVHVHNFERTVYGRNVPKNQRHIKKSSGKTKGSRRECVIPAEFSQPLIDHIRNYRSTPNPAVCAACRDGIGPWRADDHRHNPHQGCDLDADAPLLVFASGRNKGKMLTGRAASDRFQEACQRAGLTKASLGWKPLLRHSRSTGTTLLLQGGCSVDVVMELGGWSSREMIDAHYKKLQPDHKRREVAAAGRKFVALGPDQRDPEFDEDAVVESLTFQLRRLESQNARLRQHVVALGGDPDGPIATAPVPVDRRTTPLGDASVVLDAIEAMLGHPGRPSLKGVLEELGVALAGKNYDKLRDVLATLGLPQFPSGLISPKSQVWVDFRTELSECLAALRRESPNPLPRLAERAS